LFITSKKAEIFYLKPIFVNEDILNIFFSDFGEEKVIKNFLEKEIKNIEKEIKNTKNQEKIKLLTEFKTFLENLKGLDTLIKIITDYFNFKGNKKDDNKKDYILKYKRDFYKFLVKILSENLSNYLYFKTILEKILIYVRYHLKTLEKQND
jgi:hypothetical protein